MSYKLVIFDFDGTLADSFPYFLKTLNVLADTYHFKKVHPDQVDELRAMNVRQMMKLAGMPAWKIPIVANAFINMMSRDIDQISLFDGMAEVLQQLSANGVQLAIVSSNSEGNIRRVLGTDHAGLINYYSCGTSIFGKQSKFRKVMKKSGLRPHEILCIGDEIRDIEAAQAEAMPFGAVTWGYTRPDALTAHPGIAVFHTVTDILHAVVPESRPDRA
ncbi:HAD-IA family hydrolase [Larkinella insperata]|uniref:HAD-IA family hydrolase n=1 Tax=Larkinella insperata TaxID=332158 RepID=A0ABW3PXF6_9BACT|nr:HAD-IA family hydrolase [Larkinella insperata]